ncbi:thioredoxin, putative [Perkinsus marinus ATCC 50983]|uniref:Thioredoxin, putative n=1 Tax=Perkinsus marinus (strain ATCC 50983 / TXsc) TaxID=423536 RepID=C5KWN3_PERM5|nr:thioredoxin, putative [Perkinsus marinus ATCC 50983]EER11108.1 thioredoxin, putative [Perkinsus marinus ATCC 50983]|eukprot:XP_002779313.1 thioredoxin, putative [Perkinsus marinus ATCC 50983]
MSALAGKTLLTQDGTEVKADDVLSQKDKIALYFSAHWCPPCRKFTPILKEFYEDVKEEDEDKLEIIFVSSDKSEEEQVEYHKQDHGEWLRVPYGDVETRDALKKEFGVCAGIEKENLGIINNHKSGIPCLVVRRNAGVVDAATGGVAQVLDEDKQGVKVIDGVNDVKNMGPIAVDMKW